MPKQNPILFAFGDSLNEGCIRKPNDLLGFCVDSGRQMKYVSDNWHLNTLGIISIDFSWLLRQETKIQPGWGATNYAWQEWDMVTDHIMLRASLNSLQTIVTFITVAQQDCTQMCRDEQTQQPKKFEGKNCLLTFQQKTKNYAWQGWVGDCNLMRASLIKSFGSAPSMWICSDELTLPSFAPLLPSSQTTKKNLAHCGLHLIRLYSCFVSHICAI